MSDLNFDANFENFVSFKADFGVVTPTSTVVDPEVTEDSSNPVASSGIYRFVKNEVGTEKTARENSIFAETQARLEGDETIQRYVTSKIEEEKSARETSDTDLTNAIAEVSASAVKTVNHIAPDSEGNVNVEAGGSGLVDDVKVNGISVVENKVANVQVPTKVSDIENDIGYITSADIPSIPTKTSELENDSDFVTSADVPAPYDDTEIREEISGLDDKIKDLELFKFPNVTIIGTPTINNGQISDFSADSYLKFPFLVDFRSQPFEINMCFTTGSNVVQQENIFDSDYGLAFAIRNSRFVIAISTNGTSWDLGEGVGTLTVQPNTTYYIKISWNGSQYILFYSLDGTTYTADITKAGTAQPYPKQIYIGVGENYASVVNHFGGTINLNYANVKVNGEIFWTGMDDAGISTRADVSLSNIDADGEQKIKEVAETDTIKASLASKIEDSALDPIRASIANKQDKLVSGSNIKTINGIPVLGSGDIVISGGSGTVKTVNDYGPDENGNIQLPIGRIEDPINRNSTADNYRLTGDGRCAQDQNYQLFKWQVIEGTKYKIEASTYWQFQNTSNVSTSSAAAVIGEVQTGSQDLVIVPPGATWLIVSVPKTESSVVSRILRESSGGTPVSKEYVDQQIAPINSALSELDNRVDILEKMGKGILYDFVTQTVEGNQNVPKGAHLADIQKLEGNSTVENNELKSVNNTKIKVNGKNLIGLGTMYNGYINAATNKIAYYADSVSYRFETKDLPDTVVFSAINMNRSNISYTNNDPITGLYDIVNVPQNPIAIDRNYKYINIQFAYGQLVDEAQVESGTVATKYEPYHEPTEYGLVFNGKSAGTVRDELDLVSKKYIQRVGVREDGITTYVLAEPIVTDITEVIDSITVEPNGSIVFDTEVPLTSTIEYLRYLNEV